MHALMAVLAALMKALPCERALDPVIQLCLSACGTRDKGAVPYATSSPGSMSRFATTSSSPSYQQLPSQEWLKQYAMSNCAWLCGYRLLPYSSGPTMYEYRFTTLRCMHRLGCMA